MSIQKSGKLMIVILVLIAFGIFLIFNNSIQQNNQLNQIKNLDETIQIYDSNTGENIQLNTSSKQQLPKKIDIQITDSKNTIYFDNISTNSINHANKPELITTQQLKQKIEKTTERIINDFIWVESNNFVPEDTGGKIILSSIGQKTFKCDGTVDNPECFEITTCATSEKPCYEFDNGKTIVYVNHFSGAFNTMTWTTDADWNTGTYTNTTNQTNDLILSGTNTTGTYISNTTDTIYPITRIKPIWNSTEQDANKNITVEVSADAGATWIQTTNNTNYTSGASIGSGTELIFRINFSTNDSATSPKLHDITIEYDTDESAPEIDFVSPTEDNNKYIINNYTYINVTVTDDTNTTAFIDWNNSLVGWWRFNNETGENDTFARDWSIYGNNGTLTNMNTGLDNCTGNCSGWTSTGKFGKGMDFDGVDDYIDAGNVTVDLINGFTLMAWVNVNDSQTWRGIISKVMDTGLPAPFDTYVVSGTSDMRFFIGNGSSNNQWITATNKVIFNTWQYWTFIYNLTHIIIYLDGNIVIGPTLVTAPDIANQNVPLIIGNRYDDLTPMDGTIDEVKIWNRALTPEEINATYNAGLYRLETNITNQPDGTYTYTAYAQDIAGNTNQSETRTLTIDTTAPEIDFVAPTDDNNKYITNNYTYINVTVTDDTNTTAFIDWNNSLVGWWRFNNESGENNTHFKDWSSYGNNGTSKGSALTFDGVNDYVDVSTFSQPSSMSMELWLKVDSIPFENSAKIIGSNNAYLELYSSGYLTFWVYNGSNFDNTGYTISPNLWYHITATYIENNQIIYVNGIEQNSKSRGGNIQTTTGLTISNNYPPSSGLNGAFNGTIDEVRIYNRSLSATEIQEHYNGIFNDETGLVLLQHFEESSVTNATTLTDDSGAGNDGTFKDSDLTEHHTDDARPIFSTTGKFGKAINFNGIDDYLNTTHNFGNMSETQNFAISVWFKKMGPVIDGGTESLISVIAEKGTYDPLVSIDFSPQWASGNTNMRFAFRDILGNIFTFHAPSVYNDSVFHNVVLVRNTTSDNLTAYIDGSMVNTTTDITTSYLDFTGYDTFIGANNNRGTASSHFNGTIDEVKIWNRALTPEEINASYNAGLYRLETNFTNQPDGTYTYTAYAQDISGKVNQTETRTLTIDTSEPELIFTHPTPIDKGYSIENNVYVNVTVTDASNTTAFIDWNNSLVGWWRFNNESGENNTFFRDWSSYGNNGTVQSTLNINSAEDTADMDGNGLLESSSTNKKEGTYSTEVTYPATSTSWFGFISYKDYGDLSNYVSDNNYLQFWIYLEDASLITIGQIELGNTLDSAEYSWSNTEFQENNPIDGWNLISLKFEDASQGPVNWATGVDHFRIYLKSTGANPALTLRIDDLKIISPQDLIDGKFGKALDFDGVNDYVLAGDIDIVQEMTLEAWINPFNLVSAEALIKKSGSYAMLIDSSGTLITEIYNASGWNGYWGSKVMSINNWHHVSWVYNKTNIIQYIDGVEEDIFVFNTLLTTNDGYLQIGGYTTQFFNGTIDEVKIWNRALTPAEINASYNAGLYRLETNFTNQPDGTYTYTAHAQDTFGKVNQTETRSVTVDTIYPEIYFTSPTPTDNNVIGADNTIISVTATDTNNITAFIDWDNSLVGWWRFNQESGENNTFFKDWSSYGNNGTVKSSLSIGDYRKNITLSPATTLTNYQVYITVNTAELITAGKMQSDCDDIRFTGADSTTLQDYWIESGCNTTTTKMWVEVTTSGTSIIYMYYGNSTNTVWSNGVNTFLFFDDFNRADGPAGGIWSTATINGNALKVGLGYTNNPYTTVSGATPGQVAIQYTYAFGSGNGAVQAGVNNFGNNWIRTQRWGSFLDTNGNGAGSPRINSIAWGETTHNISIWWWGGGTNQFRIGYDALTATGTLTTAGANVDSLSFLLDSASWGPSTIDNLIVRKYVSPEPIATMGGETILSDFTISGTTGKFGKAINFKGVDGYVDVGTSINQSFNELTVSAWVNTQMSTASYWATIVERGNLTTGEFALYKESGTNKAGFLVNPNYVSSTTDINDGLWHYITGVYNGTNLSIYVDGNLETVGIAPASIIASTKNVTIGARLDTAPTLHFNGTIDEVKIWDRVLTPEEINASYNTGLYLLETNYTNQTDGTYTYTAYVQDISGKVNQTEQRTLTIDTIAPEIIFVDPTPTNNDYLTENNVYVNMTITDTSNTTAFIDWNNSLVGWWRFNEGMGGIVSDLSNYGNNGTLQYIEINPAENAADMDGFGLAESSSTDKKQGTYSREVTYPATSTSWLGFISYKDYGDLSSYMSDNNYLQFWIYLEDASLITIGQIELGNTVDTAEYGWGNTEFQANNPVDGWNLISLRLGDASQGPVNWATGVDHFRIYLQSTGSNPALTLRIDDLKITSQQEWTEGKYGKALSFDGLNDYVSISHNPTLNISYEMTASAWIKKDSDINWQRVITKSGWPNFDYLLLFDDAGKVYGAIKNVGVEIDTPKSDLALSIGIWYHLAMTYDNATLRFYVDGVEQGTPTNFSGLIDNNLGDLVIGSDATVSYFNGTIDDVKLWNRALTPEEINATYTSGITQHEINYTDLQDGTYNYTAYAQDLAGNTDQTETRTITIDTDNPSINFELPTFEDGAKEIADYAYVNVTTTDSNNITSFIDWDRSLVGWWRFNQESGENNTHFKDWSSYGNNGTSKGSSLTFDGVNDYVDVGNDSSVQISTGTVSAWIKTSDSGDSYRAIITKRNAYGLFLVDNYFAIYSWGGDSGLRNTTVNLADNTWHFVAFTFENNTVNGTKLYIDGLLNLTTNMTISTQDYTIQIGDGNTETQYFNGTIDEVRIYNRSLSATEIQEHYNGIFNDETGLVLLQSFTELSVNDTTILTDTSATGNDGTFYDPDLTEHHTTDASPIKSSAGKFGKALTFDGIDDYVDLGNDSSLNITNTITMEAWINPSKTGQINPALVGKFYSSTEMSYLLFDFVDKIALIIDSYGNETGRLLMRASNTLPINQWTHVVGTYNGTHGSLYVNGVKQSLEYCEPSCGSEGNYILPTGSIYTSDKPVELGWVSSDTPVFNGKIDEVKIYNRALTSAEIKASYNSGLYRLETNITNLPGGIYTFTAYVQDLAGNINQTETRTITIDTTPPNITVIAPSRSQYHDSKVMLILNVTEPETSITDCKYSLDNTANISMIKESETRYRVLAYDLTLGEHNITFTCINIVSLSSTASVNFNITAGEVLIRLESTSFIPLEDISDKYVASDQSQNTVTSLIHATGTFYNVSSNANGLSLTQSIGSKTYLIYTKGTTDTLEERAKYVHTGEFKKLFSSFGFPTKQLSKVFLSLEYDLINIIGKHNLRTGTYELLFENKGTKNGNLAINISR